MKLSIEIDDDALRAAVDSQVSKALAEMTEEVIRKKADEIIAKKFDRLDPYQIAGQHAEKILREHIDKAIESALGDRYSRNETVRRMIATAAHTILKEAVR